MKSAATLCLSGRFIRLSFTYGTLPTFEVFRERWLFELGLCGIYPIRNAPELDAVYPGGNVDLTLQTAWELLCQASEGWQDNHELGDMASAILDHFNIEWF